MIFSIFLTIRDDEKMLNEQSFISPSSTSLFTFLQARKLCSAANSPLASLRPESGWIWTRLLLLEKRKCSQLPPLDGCNLHYVYIHGFVRQSCILVNHNVLLYCHKVNLGNVISPNWQQGLGKYSPPALYRFVVSGCGWRMGTVYVRLSVCVCVCSTSVSARGSSQLSPHSICNRTPAEIKNTWEMFWSSLNAG